MLFVNITNSLSAIFCRVFQFLPLNVILADNYSRYFSVLGFCNHCHMTEAFFESCYLQRKFGLHDVTIVF